MNDDTERYLWDPDDGADTEDDEAIRRIEHHLEGYRHRPEELELADDAKSIARAEADLPDDDEATVLGEDEEEAELSPFASFPFGQRPTVRAPRRQPVGRHAGGFVRLVSGLAAALLVTLLLAEGLGWFRGGEVVEDEPVPERLGTYAVEVLEGAVRYGLTGDASTTHGAELSPGEVLICDERSRARLAVRGAGSVVVGTNSRLRIDGTGLGTGGRVLDDEASWRLFLERGELTASIFAAPRLFQLGTPSGIAVDLGCIYTARVDEGGRTTLTVDGGRVSFETAQRKVYVPAGAQVVADPVRGPGTPVWEDSPADYRNAVARLDEIEVATALSSEAERDLARVLSDTAARQTLTLFHLLDHRHADVRERAFDTLASLGHVPKTVTRRGVLAGDRGMRELWKIDLQALW